MSQNKKIEIASLNAVATINSDGLYLGFWIYSWKLILVENAIKKGGREKKSISRSDENIKKNNLNGG